MAVLISGDVTDLSELNAKIYYRGELAEDQVFDKLSLSENELEYTNNESGKTIKVTFEPVRISEELEDPIKTSNAFSFR